MCAFCGWFSFSGGFEAVGGAMCGSGRMMGGVNDYVAVSLIDAVLGYSVGGCVVRNVPWRWISWRYLFCYLLTSEILTETCAPVILKQGKSGAMQRRV